MRTNKQIIKYYKALGGLSLAGSLVAGISTICTVKANQEQTISTNITAKTAVNTVGTAADASTFFNGGASGTVYYTTDNTSITIVNGLVGESTETLNNVVGNNLILKNSIQIDNTTYTLSGIGDYAFINNSGITGTLDLSQFAGDLDGSQCFYGCSGLTSIKFNDACTTIGDGYFAECTGLEYIINLPSSLTTIGANAFKNDANATRWDMANCNGLSSIGDCAFMGCNGISLPTNPTVQKFKWFYNDPSKTTEGGVLVSLENTPNEVWTTNSSCIGGACYGIFNQVGTITSLAPKAFCGCKNLTSLTISSNIATLGDYCFQDCAGLTSFDLSNTAVTSIPAGAFIGCTSLSSVKLSSNVTSFGNYAFYGCGFKKFTWPASLTSIGDYAFSSNNNLSVVNFSSLGTAAVNIGDYAFASCEGLITVTFSGNTGITSLGIGAFSSNPKISTLDLTGTGLTSISQYAFSNCTGLKQVNLSTSNLATIDDYAFSNCHMLRKINPSESSSPKVYCLFPSCITSINQEAFANTGLSQIKLDANANLASIGQSAFTSCMNLTSLDLSNADTNLTTLNASAFAGCLNLHSVSLPASVNSIGADCFSNCRITSISYEPTTNYQKVTFNGNQGYAYRLISTSNDPTSWGTVVGNLAYGVLDFSNDPTTDTIAGGTFANCDGISKVILSNTITQIDQNAFNNCMNLGVIDFSNMNATLTIGKYAFANCYIQNIIWGTSNTYEEINVGDNGYAIVDKSTVSTNIQWTNTTSAIGGLVYGDLDFTDSNVTDMAAEACYGALGVKSITLGGELTTINPSAFMNCINVTSIAIPLTVTTIGDYAFGNTNLQEITFLNPKITWLDGLSNNWINMDGLSAFHINPPLINIYVPKASVNAYQSYVNANHPLWFDDSRMLISQIKTPSDTDYELILGLGLGLSLGIPILIGLGVGIFLGLRKPPEEREKIKAEKLAAKRKEEEEKKK